MKCLDGISHHRRGLSLTLARSFNSTRLVSYPTPPAQLLALHSLNTDSDHSLARTWIDGFTLEDVPKDTLDMGFARSSGPGGQHVNKTNSKATIRCDLLKGDWLPPFVLPALRRSPHYLPSPPSLLVSSQLTRSASQNQAAALKILHETIITATRSCIRGVTSNEQKRRIAGLIRKEEGRRREGKERIKSKKAARRGD